MVLRRLAVAVCLLVALGAGAGAAVVPPERTPRAAAKEKGMVGAYKELELKEGLFTCSAPSDWQQTRDGADDARTKTFGILLSGPAGPDGLGPSVSVRYYAPGNRVAKDAQAYLKRQLKPPALKLKGEETSKPADAAVAGLGASRFTRDTFEYVPPRSLDTKEVPVREEYFVVPRKKGFYVLRFKAPRASFDTWKPVFQKVLDTFRTAA